MIRWRSGQRKAQDRGAALILVVWAVGLMAVIAASSRAMRIWMRVKATASGMHWRAIC